MGGRIQVCRIPVLISCSPLADTISSDPYLAGALGAATVQGLQQHVVATTKHFIVNEQETNRQSGQAFAEFGISLGYNQSVSSNVDDKTMHELYLWPFQDAVRAGTGSVMCSYNRINDSYGCANSKTLNGLLKTELGFQVGYSPIHDFWQACLDRPADSY